MRLTHTALLALLVALACVITLGRCQSSPMPIRTRAISQLDTTLCCSHSYNLLSTILCLVSATAGSTFVELEYGDWQDAYMNTIDPRVTFTYAGTGSGVGQQYLLVNHSVEYACSDSPLSSAQYAAVPDAQVRTQFMLLSHGE